MQFFFADHVLDTSRRELRRGGDAIALEPQVFDLLVHLLESRDHVVTKDDLIASVWGGRIVSESTLTSRINAVRKAVGDSGRDQNLIRTIARKGFRFVGQVRCQQLGASAQDPANGAADQADQVARSAALRELRRAQPNISLDWIAKEIPFKRDIDREHYLEGLRRAGLR